VKIARPPRGSSPEDVTDYFEEIERVINLLLDGSTIALRLENRTDDPTTPATGRIWLRTDL